MATSLPTLDEVLANAGVDSLVVDYMRSRGITAVGILAKVAPTADALRTTLVQPLLAGHKKGELQIIVDEADKPIVEAVMIAAWRSFGHNIFGCQRSRRPLRHGLWGQVRRLPTAQTRSRPSNCPQAYGTPPSSGSMQWKFRASHVAFRNENCSEQRPRWPERARNTQNQSCTPP